MLTNESVAHLKNADPLRAQITPKLERLAGWAADVGVPVLVLVARLLPRQPPPGRWRRHQDLSAGAE